MDERIEVDRNLDPLTMPVRLLNEMKEHAREEHPYECCGLVLGPGPRRFESVHRCRNEMTRLHQQDPERYPRDATEAFHMNESDYLEVQTQAEERGLLVSAVYHSHADAGLYFSRLDQEYALNPVFPFPEACHIVISVMEHRVQGSAVFLRSAQGTQDAFVGRLLEAETPEAPETPEAADATDAADAKEPAP